MGEKEKNDNQQEHPVLKWFRNAVLGATMADQPAIMTASGWRQNEKGDYVQDQQNNPHVKQLRDNLAAEGAGVMLGEFGIPAIYGLYNLGIRGLGRVGNNWARAKLISKEMKDIKTPIIPGINQTELIYQPVKQQSGKTYLGFYERPQAKLTEAERAGMPKHERIPQRNTGNPYTRASIDRTKNMEVYSPRLLENLDLIDDIPTSGISIEPGKFIIGNKKISDIPNLQKTLQYIYNNIEPLPQFMDKAYYNSFINYLKQSNIDSSIISFKPKQVAQILTDQYNNLLKNQTGLTKGKIFWRYDRKPITTFNWQAYLGKNSGNSGFWGSGNYFSTGAGNGQPYLINGIEEVANDVNLGPTLQVKNHTEAANKATKWMLQNPDKRLILSIPEAMNNRYGFTNDGKTFGIELVTQKNNGIKSLFPDLTTGNGVTFPRDWASSKVNYKQGGKL